MPSNNCMHYFTPLGYRTQVIAQNLFFDFFLNVHIDRSVILNLSFVKLVTCFKECNKKNDRRKISHFNKQVVWNKEAGWTKEAGWNK